MKVRITFNCSGHGPVAGYYDIVMTPSGSIKKKGNISISCAMISHVKRSLLCVVAVNVAGNGMA